MNTTPYPIRLSEDLLTVSRLRAEEEHTDQTTALRQLLYLGAEEYLLTLVSQGRMSLGRVADLLKKSIYDLHRTAQRHGIVLGTTLEQAKESREVAKKMF